MSWRSKLKGKLRIDNKLVRIALAEFLGTFLLMIFGIGTGIQSLVSRKSYGDYFSIVIGWGLAVTMGVTASIGVSGGHINPSVTLAMAVLGRTPWKAVPLYLLGQYLGSFFAAVCNFGIYYDALTHYDPNRTVTGPTATAAVFSTYPQPEVSTLNTLADQIAGTAVLVIGVMAIVDKYNCRAHRSLVPILVGLLVIAIGGTFGYNCGYAINPARDLSPRLFSALAGWGWETFSYRNYWFWVPLVGPHIGALLGAFIYQALVGLHWQPEEREEPHLARDYGTRYSVEDVAMEDTTEF